MSYAVSYHVNAFEMAAVSVHEVEEKDHLPPTKKARLSLSLKNKPLAERNRFGSPTSDQKAAKGMVPNNTRFNTNWAVNIFFAWMKERNAKNSDNTVPEDLLESHDAVSESL